VLLFVLIGLVISSIFMIMIGEFKGVGRRWTVEEDWLEKKLKN
jgi:hypothetical protein